MGSSAQRWSPQWLSNHDCNESYAGAPWGIDAAPDEVAVIHLLCVHPQYARSGYARMLVRHAASLARQGGCKCLRLDVLAGNLPALNLYQSEGFRRTAVLPMFYEDTGWTDFVLFEFPL